MMSRAKLLSWRPRFAMNANASKATTYVDPREMPVYGIHEAARFLGISPSTLRSWVVGRSYPSSTGNRWFAPLIAPAAPDGLMLSFANLAEAHVLQATRDQNIPVPNVRAALDYVQEQIPGPHPLITSEFSHFGKNLFLTKLGEDPINASKGGQIGMAGILNEVLKRLERDNSGYPVRIFPLNRSRLVLDVNVASGQPVVKGTRILAANLWSRRIAGDSVEDIAADFNLSPEDVSEAIAHFEAA
jgi:uncharacterized protein (DUF433 family)